MAGKISAHDIGRVISERGEYCPEKVPSNRIVDSFEEIPILYDVVV